MDPAQRHQPDVQIKPEFTELRDLFFAPRIPKHHYDTVDLQSPRAHGESRRWEVERARRRGRKL